MHNLKDIRKNIEFYKKKIIERNEATNLDNLLELDKENREFIQKKKKLEQEKKLYQKVKIREILKNQKN